MTLRRKADVIKQLVNNLKLVTGQKTGGVSDLGDFSALVVKQ